MNRSGKGVEEQKAEGVKEKNSPEVDGTLQKLLSGQDIFNTVETRRGVFTMKFPRPRVLRQIQVLLAQRFEGVDLGKLPEKQVRNFEIYATLDVVVVKAPQWWDDLESSEDCPDDKLIVDLYRRYLRFYNRVQSEMSGGDQGPEEGPAEGSPGGEEETVGHGSLSGLTHGHPVPGSPGG